MGNVIFYLLRHLILCVFSFRFFKELVQKNKRVYINMTRFNNMVLLCPIIIVLIRWSITYLTCIEGLIVLIFKNKLRLFEHSVAVVFVWFEFELWDFFRDQDFYEKSGDGVFF